MVVFGEPDRGKTVDVSVGTRFCIELGENPTTGYTWSTPVLDGTTVVLESDDNAPYPNAAIGTGGLRQFVLRTTGIGKTVIRLTYRRPWEGDAAAAERFELTVVGKK